MEQPSGVKGVSMHELRPEMGMGPAQSMASSTTHHHLPDPSDTAALINRNIHHELAMHPTSSTPNRHHISSTQRQLSDPGPDTAALMQEMAMGPTSSTNKMISSTQHISRDQATNVQYIKQEVIDMPQPGPSPLSEQQMMLHDQQQMPHSSGASSPSDMSEYAGKIAWSTYRISRHTQTE